MKNGKNKIIYLDNAANTPISKSVLRAMLPYFREDHVGNAMGIHKYGVSNFLAVDKARNTIANKMGVYPEEVYFTSGATESNNWVIKGMALNELARVAKGGTGFKNKIIVSAVEHASVLQSCRSLSDLGFNIVEVPCDTHGMIRPAILKRYLDSATLLVCVMAVNNETGTENNVDYIAKLCHNFNIKSRILVDCTQRVASGSVALGRAFPNVDYITFSAHKINGPTGVGCLIIRKPAPVFPFLSGGSQESGLRGGTHNVAGIVGMAQAVKDLNENRIQHYKELKSIIINGIENINQKYGVSIKLNGLATYGNIVNINMSCLGDIDALAEFMHRGIACSAGSACDVYSGVAHASHVLKSMGLTDEEARASVRFSFDRHTTKHDIQYLIESIEDIVQEKRR